MRDGEEDLGEVSVDVVGGGMRVAADRWFWGGALRHQMARLQLLGTHREEQE